MVFPAGSAKEGAILMKGLNLTTTRTKGAEDEALLLL